MAELKKRAATTPAAARPDLKLAEAQTQLAALESDRDMLRLEKTALEDRVKQLSARPVPPEILPPAVNDGSAGRIKRNWRRSATNCRGNWMPH